MTYQCSARQTAKDAGERHYSTGKPCANGHADKRHVSSGSCVSCDRERTARRRKECPRYRETIRKSSLKRMRRLLADPETRAQIRARESELYHSRPERRANKSKADKIRAKRPEVAAAFRERARKWYDTHKNDPEYLEHRAKYKRLYYADNKDMFYDNYAKYRASKRTTCPDWLTKAQRKETRDIYKASIDLNAEAGFVKFHVDHIVPLNGSNFCGLHVPWNLSIVTAGNNLAKSNRLPASDLLRAVL